ncbi:aldo/keto reductase [Burkholderia stabilis]|nr:aldo/keto reductase [Burkholderia stabilis]
MKETDMDTRRLGRTGPQVLAIALGCMGMSDFYGPADRDESIATLHAALDNGITMLDTGDFSGMGDIVPLIGARKRTQPQDALRAPELQLTVNDLARIEAAVPAGAAAGDRYPASRMVHLDSDQARG